jgi:hypothetical protein
MNYSIFFDNFRTHTSRDPGTVNRNRGRCYARRVIRTSTVVLALSLGLSLGSVACGGPEPRSQQSMQNDGVPANSLSEKRLGKDDDHDAKKKGDDDKKPTPEATPEKADPTQPYLTPVASGGDDDPKAGGENAGEPPTPKKTGKVSKAECSQLFDKYIELSIGADARLEGIPPELIQTAKAQARQQKGDPCQTQVVKRSQYNCAITAKTPTAWQKCMK